MTAIVVVPITDCLKSGKRVIYGFLTCDAKKPTQCDSMEIFDDTLVKFLFSGAMLLGTYYTNTVTLWSDILKDDINCNDLINSHLSERWSPYSYFTFLGYAIAREISFDDPISLETESNT